MTSLLLPHCPYRNVPRKASAVSSLQRLSGYAVLASPYLGMLDMLAIVPEGRPRKFSGGAPNLVAGTVAAELAQAKIGEIRSTSPI